MSEPLACPCCRAPVRSKPQLEGPDRLHGTQGWFEVAICESCGAGVTLPQLDAAELAAFYPRLYAPYDSAKGGLAAQISRFIQQLQGRRALATAPLRALGDRMPGKVVDVGCGRGDLGAFLVERGWRVTGIEPSAEACAAARARGVDARQGTVRDVELEAGAYDAAIFRHSLEHVTDPVSALRRAHEAIRPGGQVLISVPNFGSWQARRFGSRWYHLDLPRHRVHFTSTALAAALERAGFGSIEPSFSTTPVGLPASIQYSVAGRCLFPTGMRLRAAVAASTLGWPFARLCDLLGGSGDVLSATARRPG